MYLLKVRIILYSHALNHTCSFTYTNYNTEAHFIQVRNKHTVLEFLFYLLLKLTLAILFRRFVQFCHYLDYFAVKEFPKPHINSKIVMGSQQTVAKNCKKSAETRIQCMPLGLDVLCVDGMIILAPSKYDSASTLLLFKYSVILTSYLISL